MYNIEVKPGPGTTFIAKSKDYEFIVDTEGQGVTPPDTLLASLGSCIGVYIRKYAKGSNLTLENFTINVGAEFTKQSPICFKEIKVTIDLGNMPLDQRRKNALLSFIRNCPVHNTLEVKPVITIDVS